MFKREDGAVLVLESAMIIQFVMLIIVLFVMATMLILQKNQLYYNVNHTLQMYTKKIDKPQLLSVYSNRNQWSNKVSIDQYLQLYKNPRPYQQLFTNKTGNTAFTTNTANALETYRIGKVLSEQVDFSKSTQQLIRKMAAAQVLYTLDVWDFIDETNDLSGKMQLKSPILATNDFVRQVDFASEVVKGQFAPLQQFKQVTAMFRQLNDGLRRLGGVR